MKSFLIIIFLMLSFTSRAEPSCEKIEPLEGKDFWYQSIVSRTVIVEDGELYRTWYSGGDSIKCFRTKQTDINSPVAIYSGNVMALEKLGGNFSKENIKKIRKITGILFEDSKEFNDWYEANRNNFFWSFEKNRLTVLESGFICKQIVPMGGRIYWFNYAVGSVEDLDTSSDSRLWRDISDKTKCFVSPLNEINNESNQLAGFQFALSHIGKYDEDIRNRIIGNFRKVTGNNRSKMSELFSN